MSGLTLQSGASRLVKDEYSAGVSLSVGLSGSSGVVPVNSGTGGGNGGMDVDSDPMNSNSSAISQTIQHHPQFQQAYSLSALQQQQTDLSGLTLQATGTGRLVKDEYNAGVSVVIPGGIPGGLPPGNTAIPPPNPNNGGMDVNSETTIPQTIHPQSQAYSLSAALQQQPTTVSNPPVNPTHLHQNGFTGGGVAQGPPVPGNTVTTTSTVVTPANGNNGPTTNVAGTSPGQSVVPGNGRTYAQQQRQGAGQGTWTGPNTLIYTQSMQPPPSDVRNHHVGYCKCYTSNNNIKFTIWFNFRGSRIKSIRWRSKRWWFVISPTCSRILVFCCLF